MEKARPAAADGNPAASLADRDGWIWQEGKLVAWREATVHVLAHGLHYGTAVFEGVRAYSTDDGPAVFRLAEHTDRLLNSAKILGMPVEYDRQQLMDAQRQVVRANGLDAAYIRPLIYLGPESLGIDIARNRSHAVIAAWAWGTYLGEEGLERGIRVRTSSFWRHHPAATMCRGKISGNYVNSVLAHSEAVADGYDEALQLDTSGYVSEGSGENLFLVFDGRLVTPALDTPLAGITRQTILELAAEEGIECIQRRVTRDDLYIADEAFFTGTAAEVTPVREIDRRRVGAGSRGPVTERLQRRFFDCVSGRDGRHADWLTAVGSG